MNPKRLCATATLIALLASSPSFAGDWTGKYKTEDTKGNVMNITLSSDGTAEALKHGKTLNGTWTDEEGDAVIKWSTGWTTALSKSGDTYTKSAYRPGMPMTDGPAHTGPAERVE